jgi:hypothetical protein
MKNTFKVKSIQRIASIIAIVAIIGFSVVACSDNSGGNNGGNTGGNTGGAGTQLSGTYYGEGSAEGASITFSSSNWTFTFLGADVMRGTYKVNGSNVEMILTWVDSSSIYALFFRVGDTDSMTLGDNGRTLSGRTLLDPNEWETYRKR